MKNIQLFNSKTGIPIGKGIGDYYDIESSLTFEPSGTYYYARIGEKYIKKILDTQSDVRLKSGLTPINLYNIFF